MPTANTVNRANINLNPNRRMILGPFDIDSDPSDCCFTVVLQPYELTGPLNMNLAAFRAFVENGVFW